uniref:Beta-defensin 134 n=1 Tax=Garrulax canorus TaxID=238855 RepID=A0A3G1B551_9PASS|nr:beta-defensin 134 [Garrulax canorus]
MKILFLLLPLILLLVQGAAGSSHSCWIANGFCSRPPCPSGRKVMGRCSPSLVCCKK